MTITELIQRCIAGDQSAAQTLVQSHQQAVLHLAQSILGDPEEAEEAAQEAFITAFSSLATFRGESSFKTWLFSIAINRCLKRLRARQAQQRLKSALQSIFRLSSMAAAHPEDIIIRREARTELSSAISGLGEKHRLPLLLHYEHGLSVEEISQALNLRPGTVLSRLFTARERLRKALQADPRQSIKVGVNERS